MILFLFIEYHRFSFLLIFSLSHIFLLTWNLKKLSFDGAIFLDGFAKVSPCQWLSHCHPGGVSAAHYLSDHCSLSAKRCAADFTFHAPHYCADTVRYTYCVLATVCVYASHQVACKEELCRLIPSLRTYVFWVSCLHMCMYISVRYSNNT